MTTTGAQRKALRLALESAYPDYDSLQLFLDEDVGRKLASKVAPAGMEQVVHKLIQWSESKGWTADLVTAAYLNSPDNLELKALHEDGVFSPAPAVRRLLDDPGDTSAPVLVPNHAALAAVGDRQQLQTMLNAAVGMVDAVVWAVTFLEQAGRVCSISVVTPGGNRSGTGLLVGPDLVLTNHHVVAPVIDGASPQGVTCRFDYHVVDSQHVEMGTAYGLAPDWLVASSPPSAADLEVAPAVLPTTAELDFALLRLDKSPGHDLRPGGSHRGWVDVRSTPATIGAGQPLVILQHPLGLPVKWAPDTEGVLAVNANATRVTYRTNTEEGSSGSPCFAFDLAKVVALHHAGEPAYGAGRNEGIPLHTIVGQLRGTAAGRRPRPVTAKLTPKERKDLQAVLQEAYPTYDELDMFLDTFDHRLALITQPEGMDLVVFKVVRKASDKDWLPELVENLLAEGANDERVLAVARRLGLRAAAAAAAAGPAAYKLADLTYFDLTEIEAHFRDVRIERETTRLVLTAVDCQEAMFLDSLQRRIAQIVRVDARHRIQVDGAAWTVARALDELGVYAATLNDLPVFCPVMVLSTAEDVDALASGVTRMVASPANEFVVLLFIRSGWTVPTSVAALPSPAARPADVDKWVEAIGDELTWDQPTRTGVRGRILAAVRASDVPVYEVYKQLQGEIDRLKLAKPPAA